MAKRIFLIKQLIIDLSKSLWLRVLQIKFNKNINYKKGVMIIVGCIVVLLLMKVLFSRRVSVYNFSSTLPSVETFLSLNKTNDQLEMGGLLLKNKVTRFNLVNEKKLDTIKIHMAYKPGQKEIKIGIRGNETNPFVYKSLFFDPINSLTWEKTYYSNLVLYQKIKQFDSVPAFLSNIPTDKKIGIYQVDTNQLVPYIFTGKPVKNKTVIPSPIRGNVTAYVLVTGGDLKIKVTKQDMNMYDGNDVLNATLTLGGVKVGEMQIPDDGFADKSKSQTAPQVYSLNLANAKAGVYKIDLKFDSPSNDSVITNIEVNQAKVVIGGSILIWNNAPATFFTYSTKISANTTWAESIQNLKVDDKADLAIKDIKTKFAFDLAKTITDKYAPDLYKIYSPKGNINFGTGGYFSISPESYFDPAVIKATNLTVSTTQADIEKNYDFVLTTLAPAKEENYWLVSDLILNTAEFPLIEDKIFFSLEIPDLDKQGGSLEVGGLTVSLSTK